MAGVISPLGKNPNGLGRSDPALRRSPPLLSRSHRFITDIAKAAIPFPRSRKEHIVDTDTTVDAPQTVPEEQPYFQVVGVGDYCHIRTVRQTMGSMCADHWGGITPEQLRGGVYFEITARPLVAKLNQLAADVDERFRRVGIDPELSLD